MNKRLFSARSGRRLTNFLAVSCLALFLTACVGGETQDTGGRTSEPALDASYTKLAYGVSIKVPSDWTIVEKNGPENITKANVEATVASGKPVMLAVTAHRASTPDGFDANITFVAIPKGGLMPEDKAKGATQEQFDGLAKNMLEQQLASIKKSKQKEKVRPLSLKIYNAVIDNKTALFRVYVVSTPEGKTRVADCFIYLPGSDVAILANAVSDAEVAGLEGIITSFIRTIKIN